MFHLVKERVLDLRWATVLPAAFFVLALTSVPVSARAQCANWDASGIWNIKQQGQDFSITLNLEQKGIFISGTANALQWVDEDKASTKNLSGAVDGKISAGGSFFIQILWANDQTGIYVASILPTGRLEGEGYEKNTPNIRVPWHSLEVLKCPPPPPAPAPPKPIKSSGKMPKSQPATPAPPKPPFITTGQIIVQPYVPVASVYLGWDGGADHPNAEVMAVNEDGQTLMFKELFKKPKGALDLRLQRGRQYMYVLRDNGVTLATVNLVVP